MPLQFQWVVIGLCKRKEIVTLLDISVDQFFYPDKQNEESDCRQHIDRMLNTMDENELTIMEATAEGIQKARETEEA